MASTEGWRDIAARKEKEQLSKIPISWLLPPYILDSAKKAINVLDIPKRSGLLTAKELDITESYDATSLAMELSSRRLSSLEVTVAFCKRAAIAHQVVCRISMFSSSKSLTCTDKLPDRNIL